MKELSIEEKAIAYDEAIERAKKWRNAPNIDKIPTFGNRVIEEIFPELKESGDEKIRKELIQYLNDYPNLPNGHYCRDDFFAWLEKQGEQKTVISDDALKEGIAHFGITQYQIDNWLKKYVDVEKQGEQKPTDKIEPKFKVGDSISKKHNSDINKFGIFTITSIADNKYWYNDSVICDFSDQDLWELVEQPKFKKGDWVFHNTAEFIYMIQTIGRDGYGVISRDGKKSVVYYSAEINYRLWTIQDAKDGDVLVDGNLPFIFKKIDTNRYSYAYCGISVDDGFKIESDGEFGEWTWMQDIKPATKEQRDILFQKMKESGYEWNAEKKELKQVEQKSAWSEQDEELIKCSINNLTELKDRFGEEYGKVGDCITWLKHLKDRVQPQPKQEWSEEDEEHIKSLLERLEGMCKKYATFIRTKFAVSEDEDWLKSLSPQSRWKPSKEQMKALWNVYQGGKEQAELATLYNDLKKLREE